MIPFKPSKISAVSPGQPISAAHYNSLVAGINRLMDAVASLPGGGGALLRLAELDEDLPQYQRAKSANQLYYDNDVSAGSDPMADWGLDDEYVAEIQNGVHLDGERVVLLWDKSSGRHVVFPFAQMHLAKLTTSLAAGSSASARIWKMGASEEEASTVSTFTVYDWTLGGGTIPSGTAVRVGLHRQSRRWYVLDVVPPKPFAVVSFGAALTTATESISGTLLHQYGYGADHASSSCTLYNMDDNAGGYIFSGASGAVAFAVYRGSGTSWQLVTPECPAS